MGILDKVFDNKDDDKNKPKADFSDVRGGASSTAPDAQVPTTPAAEPGASSAARTYTIRGGDNLRKIAKHFYGDEMKWRKIYDANRDTISNPDLIHEGASLHIPEA